MPKKGQKVAARQAELNRRKRRNARGRPHSQSFDTGPEEAEQTSATVAVQNQTQAPQSQPSAQGQPAQSSTPASRPAARAAQQARRPNRQRVQPDSVLTYKYLGIELRNIGILGGLVAVILTVLTFLLR